jgi:hypothetical protein
MDLEFSSIILAAVSNPKGTQTGPKLFLRCTSILKAVKLIPKSIMISVSTRGNYMG